MIICSYFCNTTFASISIRISGEINLNILKCLDGLKVLVSVDIFSRIIFFIIKLKEKYELYQPNLTFPNPQTSPSPQLNLLQSREAHRFLLSPASWSLFP